MCRLTCAKTGMNKKGVFAGKASICLLFISAKSPHFVICYKNMESVLVVLAAALLKAAFVT